MVGGLLAFYRHLPALAVLQYRKAWVDGASVRNQLGTLRGKRMVVLGAGVIGRTVHQQLSGFECRVQLLAHVDPNAQFISTSLHCLVGGIRLANHTAALPYAGRCRC